MSRPNSRLVVALCAVALLGTACSPGEGAVSDGATAPVGSPSSTPGGGQLSAPDDSLAVAVTPADDAEKVRPDQAVPVEGTWHWNDDKQVNFRPKVYWPAHTRVTVNIDTRGVKAGDGLWGWANRKIEFQIGTSVVSRVDVVHHVMTVSIDGKVARRIPVTAGKDGFTTRSGNKVIMEKFRVKRMDARTVGIKPGDPEYYDIHDVQYAHRVTSSGEFVHGAPWSSGSQGRENVSHGCVGMSLANGAWYFGQTHIGDPVIVTGTSRRMEPGNGWTDWNVSWDTYKRGSALN